MQVFTLRSLAVICVCLCFAAVAGAASALDFPALTGRVVDNAGLLDSAQERRLTDQLRSHEEATSNQVVVVTLTSLQGTTIEDFGYQLGRHWGIGQAGRDNGVLLIVAPKERKVRIEVGYGLEGDLPDAIARTIIDNDILPAFRRDDYPAGIEAGVSAIILAIEGAYEPMARRSKKNETFRYVAFVFLVIMLLIFVRFLYQVDPGGAQRWPGGGRRINGRSSDRSGGGFGRGGFRGGGFGGGGGGFGGGGSSGSW